MKQAKKKQQALFLKIFFLLLITIITVAVTVFLKNDKYCPNSWFFKREPEPWITVFIHGSFGSVLGFLNTSDVLKDKISGTIYRKITKGMRDDTFFFRYQPILKRGLVRVIPTFNIKETGNQFLAAYPLIKSYDMITEQLCPGKEKNYYYTFGWSGLMSQNSRRFESIRLYNALSEELVKFHAQGIYPKIRLIAHSHGGNLCLNLGAVHTLANLKDFSMINSLSQDPDENEALKKMYAVMRTLPSKDSAHLKPDQKRFDYMPSKKNLEISQLIFYGTPIQPETESFVCAPVFKKVYNFYSGEDIIQKFDWVTSKRSSSFQRVDCKKTTENVGTCFIQAKIMIEKLHNMGKGFKPVAMQKSQFSQEQKNSKIPERTIWEQLMAGENIFSRKSKDPTHKELWFFCWESSQDSEKYTTFLAHLPTFVLTPLYLAVLHAGTKKYNDIDINTVIRDEKLVVVALEHDREKELSHYSIPVQTLDVIKQKTMAWKPDRWKSFDEFKEIRKHL